MASTAAPRVAEAARKRVGGVMMLDLLSLCPLLADSGSLPDPKSPESVGWLVLTIAAVAVALNQVMSVWLKLHPKKLPPDHEVWATKLELAKLEKDHKEEMARIEKRFAEWITQQAEQHDEEMTVWREWKGSLDKWTLTIERALGHVETKAELALQHTKPGAKPR